MSDECSSNKEKTTNINQNVGNDADKSISVQPKGCRKQYWLQCTRGIFILIVCSVIFTLLWVLLFDSPGQPIICEVDLPLTFLDKTYYLKCCTIKVIRSKFLPLLQSYLKETQGLDATSPKDAIIMSFTELQNPKSFYEWNNVLKNYHKREIYLDMGDICTYDSIAPYLTKLANLSDKNINIILSSQCLFENTFKAGLERFGSRFHIVVFRTEVPLKLIQNTSTCRSAFHYNTAPLYNWSVGVVMKIIQEQYSFCDGKDNHQRCAIEISLQPVAYNDVDQFVTSVLNKTCDSRRSSWNYDTTTGCSSIRSEYYTIYSPSIYQKPTFESFLKAKNLMIYFSGVQTVENCDVFLTIVRRYLGPVFPA